MSEFIEGSKMKKPGIIEFNQPDGTPSGAYIEREATLDLMERHFLMPVHYGAVMANFLVEHGRPKPDSPIRKEVQGRLESERKEPHACEE